MSECEFERMVKNENTYESGFYCAFCLFLFLLVAF